MNAGLMYGLGGRGLFVVCAIAVMLLLPNLDVLLLRLLIALVVSAVLSFFLAGDADDAGGKRTRERRETVSGIVRSARFFYAFPCKRCGSVV